MATTAAPAASTASCATMPQSSEASSAVVQLLVAGKRHLAPIERLRLASPVFARMLSPEWAPTVIAVDGQVSAGLLVLHESPDCVNSFANFLACLLEVNDEAARIHLPLDDWPRIAGVLLLADKYLADGVRRACESVLCDQLMLLLSSLDFHSAEDVFVLPWWLAEYEGLRWLQLSRACALCLQLAGCQLRSLLWDESAGRAFLAGLTAQEFASLLAAAVDFTEIGGPESAADALIVACENQWPAVDDDDKVKRCLASLLTSASRRKSPQQLLLLLDGPQFCRLRQLRPRPAETEWRLAAAAISANWFRLRVPIKTLLNGAGRVARMSHDSRLFYTLVAGPDSESTLIRFHFLPAASGCSLWTAPVDWSSGCPLGLRRLPVPPRSAPSVGSVQLDYACWGHAGTVEVLPDWAELRLPTAAINDVSGDACLLVHLETEKLIE